MKAIIAGAALAALATAQAAAQAGGPQEASDAFHAALAAGDSTAALELLDPEVVIFEGGGVERSREEYRSHHLGADMSYAAATRRAVTRRSDRVFGETAVVLSEVRTTGEFRGRAVDRVSVETMVLRHTADGWRIVHIHWSSRR